MEIILKVLAVYISKINVCSSISILIEYSFYTGGTWRLSQASDGLTFVQTYAILFYPIPTSKYI